MIHINADEIYFIVPHYEDLNGVQKLIPNLIDHGAKKIGIFDGPFVTFQGGSGKDVSEDGSLEYLKNIRQVEVHKMGRCWMYEKLTFAFARAAELGYKYCILIGCDEWLEGDFSKFGINTDKAQIGSMPFREHHVDDMYNRNVVQMHRLFINPENIESRTRHYQYYDKRTGKLLKYSTFTSGTVTIHHDDRVRDEKRNKEMEEYQTKNKFQENENRAREIESLNEFSIFLGVPNNGSIHPDLAVWLINMQHGLNSVPGYQGLVIDLKPAKRVDNARNIIVKSFLESQCTHLLMVDSDIIPTYNTIEQLLMSNKDVIAPKMPIWMGPEIGLTYPAYSKDDNENTNLKGVREVDFVGTGCMLIKRKVLQKMSKPWFKFITDEYGIEKSMEDNYFCQNVKKAGFKIFIDQDIIVRHYNTIELSEINQYSLNKSSVKINKITS